MQLSDVVTRYDGSLPLLGKPFIEAPRLAEATAQSLASLPLLGKPFIEAS